MLRRMLDAPAMCLSAVFGSAPLLTLHRKRSQRDAWTLSHLARLPGAGRLPVNVGWRHPRPVAANDERMVAAPAPPGDKQGGRSRLADAVRPLAPTAPVAQQIVDD